MTTNEWNNQNVIETQNQANTENAIEIAIEQIGSILRRMPIDELNKYIKDNTQNNYASSDYASSDYGDESQRSFYRRVKASVAIQILKERISDQNEAERKTAGGKRRKSRSRSPKKTAGGKRRKSRSRSPKKH